MNKLEPIIAAKRREVAALLPRAGELRRAAAAREDVRSLRDALRSAGREAGLSLIAEIKRASPSAGAIAPDIDPVAVARAYEDAGAAAISVLTDREFFDGSLDDLVAVRRAVAVPVLRKDFIVHEVQIHEAAGAGADAVLLIVAALDQELLRRLLDVAAETRLDALVEVHDLDELHRALDTRAAIIGINNRNLKTFEVDLETTARLSGEVRPDIVLVSESGIKSVSDARFVRECGADAILVGETLMRSAGIAATVRELTGA